MQNMPRVIDIFYAFDEAFAKFAIVSMTSLIHNASEEKQYHIHILHTEITPKTREQILRLEREGVRITFEEVSTHLRTVGEKLPIRDYYSKTTYYRLFIAEMFPELEKAIYIDSDTVVQGDISELYAYDLEGWALGACHEQAMVQEDAYGTYVEQCLGIDRNSYFNAGVLLINCKYFREKHVLESFVRLLGEYDFRVTQDEDYLNVICKDHVRFLPQTWNTEIFGEIADPKEACNVLHYIMVSKPWHYEDCRWGDVFWRYAAMTEVHDEIRQVLADYTDEQRVADGESAERLKALAISETHREDNYLRRLNQKRDAGRLEVLQKIADLEAQGIFDRDVEEDPPARQIQPGEVDYLGRKLKNRILFRFAHALARRFVYDQMDKKQLIIKDVIGLEHFKELRTGAILTCNHFNAYDSFAIQMAYEYSNQRARKKHFYRIIREGNYTSFPGFFGFLMRHYHTLPLSSNRKTMKEFIRATDTLLQEGHFVLIYPEQSMWWNYRKPKPLKEGGFYFAAKNRVPILPCFIVQRDSDVMGSDGFPVQEYTIHIHPPVFPKEELSVSANTAYMMEENARIWKEIYEKEYGMPLQYRTKTE
ncbi:MAG: 1-acyl-sn-glycerol-3-phosphate acyltransferase [Clostridia bacterium]|nr:1-acyl-sn-glycerol-3-phosphate acyltransferase [Clostridia bacterium]